MKPTPPYISALASAIRTRLTEGSDVALTGFGVLSRSHEAARVSTREDGQKVLLPPRDTIHFAPNPRLDLRFDDALVEAFSAAVSSDLDDPHTVLDDTLGELRGQFKKEGELLIGEAGHFANRDGTVIFEATDSLSDAVNKPFAGLSPIEPSITTEPEEAHAESITPPLAEDWDQGDEWASEKQANETDFVPAATVLDVLNNQSSDPEIAAPEKTEHEEIEPLLDLPIIAESTIGEVEAEEHVSPPLGSESEVEIVDEIEPLLEGIWTPVSTPGERETLEPRPRSIEDEGYPSVLEEVSLSEEASSPFDSLATSTTVPVAPVDRAAVSQNGFERDKKRTSRRRMVLAMAAVILGAIAIIALWPSGNQTGDRSDLAADTNSQDGSATDPLYSTHAGGTADSDVGDDADVSTFESSQMQQEAATGAANDLVTESRQRTATPEPVAENPRRETTREPVTESTQRATERESYTGIPIPAPSERQATVPAPPPNARQETAPTPAPSTRQATPPTPANTTAPQLHGSAEIDPAQGGATWIVASGNRTSANELAARYRRQGFRSSVLPGEANGMTVYRVAVGQFANAAEANRFKSRLPADAPAGTWLLNL